MSISMKELNRDNVPLTAAMQANLSILFERMNKIRAAWKKPMKVTSGVRSIEDHKRIYRSKAGPDATVLRIPMGSQHLKAGACDIADPDGSLMKWTKENVALLEQVGLWVEDGTVGWVHYQVAPPGSGKRFFKP